MKKLAIGLIGIIVVIAAAGYFISSNLDVIVKAAIEKYGSAAAHTAVGVDRVTIALRSGEAAVHGLRVANPEGFAPEKALVAGMISVTIDTDSITGDGPIIIREVVIEKPQVRVEALIDGSTNLQALARNAAANKPAASTDPADTKKAQRKIIINDLYVRDGQITIRHPLLQGEPLTASLSTIHLSNIGKANGGITYAQVANLLLTTISTNAGKVAASDLSKNLGSVKDALQKKAPDMILNHVGGLLGK